MEASETMEKRCELQTNHRVSDKQATKENRQHTFCKRGMEKRNIL